MDLDKYRFESYPSSYSKIGVRDGINAGSARVIEVVGVLEKVTTCNKRPCLIIKTKIGNKVINLNLDLNSNDYILAMRQTKLKSLDVTQNNENVSVGDMLNELEIRKPKIIRIEAISAINSSVFNSKRCKQSNICIQRAKIYNDEFKKNAEFISMYKKNINTYASFSLFSFIDSIEYDLVLPTLIDFGLVK